MATPLGLTETFRDKLSLFAFFHLGSDAVIDIQEGAEGLRVSVAHSRVVPFEFEITWPHLEQLLAEPSRFEAFMLDHLTRYRQS